MVHRACLPRICMAWVLVLGALVQGCAAHDVDFNATIGLLMPVSFRGFAPLSWLQWSASALLAMHHINTQNATVVGLETLSRVPANFKIAYKFSNSGFTGLSAAAAIFQWKALAGATGYTDDACSALKNSANASKGVPDVRAKYEAHKWLYPDAIVGCARSDAATIVSTIASLDAVPLMGFAATSSDLADKNRYPYFSRTNPGSSVDARAVTGLAKHFGWTSLNIIAVDSTFGSGYTSDISSWASKDGIMVANSLKFIDGDQESIKSGMAALSEAVYNSSAPTRSHINVLLANGQDTLQYIIKYGLEYQLLGTGFVWIQIKASGVDSWNDREGDAISSAVFRQHYAGFINIAGVQMPTTLTSVLANDPATSSKAMSNQVMEAAGASYEAAFLRNPANTNKSVSWQLDASLLDVGGSPNMFAYDAVWATAIGLVAAKQQGDKANLHLHCRNGGGKGPFKGASGTVTFDLTSGERASLGMAIQIQNIIAPANPDWATFKYEGPGWVDLGVWEEGAGFVRQVGDVTPFWPGGLRSWTAPPSGFPAPLQPIQNQTETLIITQVVREIENAAWDSRRVASVVAPTILIVLALVAAGYAMYHYSMKPKGDEEEHSLHKSTRMLRQRLHIANEHGYILSSEKTRWSPHSAIIIPSLQMHAAVRLWRLEDFDIDAFDAFCVLIADNEYHGEGELDASIIVRPQMKVLEEWLLKHASTILCHLSLGPDSQDGAAADLKIVMPNNASGDITFAIDPLQATSSANKGFNRSKSKRSMSNFRGKSKKSMSVVSSVSSNHLYRYWRQKIMAVRLWRDDNGALFSQLKIPVQELMDTLAKQCHERVREFVHDPDGHALCNFYWSPVVGEFSREQMTKEEIVRDRNVRQDDEEVEAVTVNKGSEQEHQMEQSNPRLQLQLKASGLCTESDETVFITQLHRRGRLLDRAFKSHVLDMLAQTLHVSEDFTASEFPPSFFPPPETNIFGNFAALDPFSPLDRALGVSDNNSAVSFVDSAHDFTPLNVGELEHTLVLGMLSRDSVPLDAATHINGVALDATLVNGVAFGERSALDVTRLRPTGVTSGDPISLFAASPLNGVSLDATLVHGVAFGEGGGVDVSPETSRVPLPPLVPTPPLHLNGVALEVTLDVTRVHHDSTSAPSAHSHSWNEESSGQKKQSIKIESRSCHLLGPRVTFLPSSSPLPLAASPPPHDADYRLHHDPDHIFSVPLPCTAETHESTQSSTQQPRKVSEESAMGSAANFARHGSATTVSESAAESGGATSICVGFFSDGPANLEIFFAPIKCQARMREKISKYNAPHPHCQWPLTANVMDPIRLSIVCSGPKHLLQTVRWFVTAQAQTGLVVTRIKNKFLLPESEVQDGYRDVALNVIFEDASGLKIIGEIQVHDRQVHDLKLRMHKLYKVKRANNSSSIA